MKKILFSFFWLCLVKMSYFWRFLDKIEFTSNDPTLLKKRSLKFNYKLNLGWFLFKSSIHLTIMHFWLKYWKNVDFLLNKVRKIANKNYFMIKYKMLYIYDFHIDFQFRAKKSHLQMGLAHPWQFCCKVDGSRNPMDGFWGSL